VQTPTPARRGAGGSRSLNLSSIWDQNPRRGPALPGDSYKPKPTLPIAISVAGKCEVVHTALVTATLCMLILGNKPNGTRVEMRKLVATITLLCLSSTVLAHDIYSTLRDRAGHLCCNEQDCMPVEATMLPDGNYYLPKTNEIIAADMATPSPDNRFHHCAYRFESWGGAIFESTPTTRCFFAPMNSCSHRWYPGNQARAEYCREKCSVGHSI
jgi:hypothetical protein